MRRCLDEKRHGAAIMQLPETIEAIIIVTMAISLMVSGLYIGHYKEKYQIAAMEITQLNSEIAQLKYESEQKQKTANMALEKAMRSIEETNKKAQLVMKQKVPVDCNKAIQWGIKQAKGMQLA